MKSQLNLPTDSTYNLFFLQHALSLELTAARACRPPFFNIHRRLNIFGGRRAVAAASVKGCAWESKIIRSFGTTVMANGKPKVEGNYNERDQNTCSAKDNGY